MLTRVHDETVTKLPPVTIKVPSKLSHFLEKQKRTIYTTNIGKDCLSCESFEKYW